MIKTYPAYYENFRCIADRCEDTCCAGWEIDIDDATYEAYMQVDGELGERLRACIRAYDEAAADANAVDADGADSADADTVDADDADSADADGTRDSGGYEEIYEAHGFILTDDMRCPFLDEHNLCDIYRALGEEALCEVCTNTPRNFLEYYVRTDDGDAFVSEVSVSASCPEAARLIYGSPEKMQFISKTSEELGPDAEKAGDATMSGQTSGSSEVSESEAGLSEIPEGEPELGAFLRCVRDEAIRILQDRDRELPERIRRFLRHAEAAQEAINAWESDGDELPEGASAESGGTELPDGIIEEADVFLSKLEGVTGASGDAGERYRHFLIRMGTFSGLASIGDRWADRVELIYRSFIGDADETDDDGETQRGETDFGEDENNDFSARYTNTSDNLQKYLTEKGRLYEYEHLLVYYAFLLLNRSIDDYDYLGKAKLVVLSYLMNRDMDTAVFLQKGSLAKEDREENARIYAREVEHAEENLADLAEEILFERAFDTDALIGILG
ncbi:MAG: flagellin lysine-N-methylase [Eubacterium sp.]|nr:flagellin lysine-N-methylase [Eubacterium sp.]